MAWLEDSLAYKKSPAECATSFAKFTTPETLVFFQTYSSLLRRRLLPRSSIFCGTAASPTCFAPGFVSSLDGTLAGHVGDIVDVEADEHVEVEPQHDDMGENAEHKLVLVVDRPSRAL